MIMPIARITRGLAAAFAACAAIAASGVAAAQSYPSKPIKLLVPLAAGSTADIVSRFAADELSKALGQPNQKLGRQGFDLAPPMAPTAFGKLISDDLLIWVPIVKASGAAAN